MSFHNSKFFFNTKALQKKSNGKEKQNVLADTSLRDEVILLNDSKSMITAHIKHD
jgi:hypothetical protein